MTREEVAALAQEAKLNVHDAAIDLLERFANLVLAKNSPHSSMAWQEGFEAGRLVEREACAKVCEETTASWTQHLYNQGCIDCAAAIRGRNA